MGYIQARRSLAFGLLAAYHSYVFFAAALSILTLSGNLILAWFISWFQEVRNGSGSIDPGKVSLGYYLAVLIRCWMLIHLSAELLRCTLWLVEDCWELQTFQTYRQVCTGAAFQKMRMPEPGPTVAQRLARVGWAHGSSVQWWLDLFIQLVLYSTLDVVPLVIAVPSLLRLDLVGFLSALFATACSAGVAHVVLLYLAWTMSDVVAKVAGWKAIRGSDMADLPTSEAEVPEEPAAEEAVEPEAGDPLEPSHFCALFGGILHLGWVTVLKAVVFICVVVFAIQKDAADENPFWLVAALLLGVAFWHSILAQGLKFMAGCLDVTSWGWGRCLSCSRNADETLGGEVSLGFVSEQRVAEVQAWGVAHAGLSAKALSMQYELAVYALLLQLTLFGNFKWLEGAVVILLLILLILSRRATLASLGQWCGLVGIIEAIVFVVLAVAINAAYSPSAGLGVLVMALLLQCTLARQGVRE